MVNWHDPALLLKDYIALIKLNHAIAGIFIWETVFTAGFELDVLRGKRPYRWTIWLYLGTRYTTLVAFIFFFIDTDGPRVPCKPFMIASFALPYASWAFASLIIVLRVIAIWNCNVIISIISIGAWTGGLALNVRNLTMVDSAYNPLLETCIVGQTHRGLLNAAGVLVVDLVLLVSMLIGLLRHAQRSTGDIWRLLYRQCIIWMVLAGIAEIPPVVFLILNLNDPWNEMLTGTAITILSISATRMYRSLSERGSLTEYTVSDRPQFSSGTSVPTAQSRGVNVYSPMNFTSATHSNMTRTTFEAFEAPVFLPANYVQVEFVPGVSNPSLAHESTKNKTGSAGFEMV